MHRQDCATEAQSGLVLAVRLVNVLNKASPMASQSLAERKTRSSRGGLGQLSCLGTRTNDETDTLKINLPHVGVAPTAE